MLRLCEATSNFHVHSRVMIYPLSVSDLNQSSDQPLCQLFSSGLEVVGFDFVVAHFNPEGRYAAFQEVVPAKTIVETGQESEG